METIARSAFKERGIGNLAEIPGPPERLWLRGALPAAGMKRLAVVGSRALTPYGREACAFLVGGLRGYPISIVSGLALGADAAAHEAALAAGLHTLAVPGSGLDDRAIAPRTNLGLARRILAAGGALLAEHPPGTLARPEYFPSRNRIMAGLADAILVLEAGERSGTLRTARLAAEYGRELLCVPHRIGDAHGAGAHQFLRLGATLAAEPCHILEALNIESHAPGAAIEAPPALSGPEAALYALLAEPSARDDLIRASGLPAGEALSALVALELRGLARESFGAWRRA